MDFALLNNSLEYSMQTLEQDSYQSPTWSSSDIIGNNEELLSFIGDSNMNLQFMDTLEKLNSPKLDKESDIRDSLVEFLQEQLRSCDSQSSKTIWTDLDLRTTGITNSSLFSHNSTDSKKSGKSTEKIKNVIHTQEKLSKSVEPELGFQLQPSSNNPQYTKPRSFLNLATSFNSDHLASNRNTNQCVAVASIETFTQVAKERGLKCKTCSYKTQKECLLKHHMIKHIGNSNFICNMCHSHIACSEYLVHIKKHAFLCFECPLCCYTSLEEADFCKHILKHASKYMCTVCKSATRTIINKPKSSQQSLSMNFSCNLCKYTTKHESHLQKHKLKHTKVFECYLCDYKASYKKMLIQHCSKHTGIIYKCALCDFQTVYRNNFKYHQIVHRGEKLFICHVCGFRFAQRSNLKVHVSTHLGEKNFQCYLCDYKATQKVNLKAHVITHIGEKDLACNVCDYKASNRSILKIHMTVHSSGKIFECNLCGYKTAHNSGLRRHLRVHTGEKNFLCDLCNYKTSRKDYINRHMLTHTRKKNFACTFCDYKCSYRNGLNVHLAAVHNTGA